MTDTNLGAAAGGMALTAEQVEDVRTALRELRRVDHLAPLNRLRALFPATEPAEDAKPCGSNSVTLGWCKLTARHEGLHTNGTYLWGTPSEPDPPAPAEPAEEETKAEEETALLTPNQIRDANPGKHQTYIYGQQSADGTACIGCNWETRNILPVSEAVMAHDSAKNWTHDHSVWITKNGICPCGQPASSPVVPAPTETGPWQTWQEVPEGVQYYGINGWGPTYYVNRGGVRYRVFDDTPSKTADYVVQNFAPFVAAEEG